MNSLVVQISEPHQKALNWFQSRTGDFIRWPGSVDGIFLANKAKGIHKPAGFQYALSVRQSAEGPYADEVQRFEDGSWTLNYAQEGNNSDYFTNRALLACLRDSVPIGVLLQRSKKPHPSYEVLGLGKISAYANGFFEVRSYGRNAKQGSSHFTPHLESEDLEFDRDDDRLKQFKAIVVRRGQPEFRKKLLAAYDFACAISGSRVNATLEAAHIVPYLGKHSQDVRNGIVLRADLHILFDMGLLKIEPFTYVVSFDKSV